MMETNARKSDVVVAVDIGTTKVCAIAGRKNQHGKLEILGVGKVNSEGVLRGVVSNIEKTVNAISEAVIAARRGVNANFDWVHVGIAGQHIKSLQHRGILMRDNNIVEISQEDIDRLIGDMYKLVLPPGDKIIHVIPQEYAVDNEQGILDPIGMSGVRLEANFHIITGHINAAMNINKCVQKAGLEVKDIILEPIASADAVLNFEEKEAGVVLVDIGGGTTDVAIFHEGVIRHTAVIPFGGNVITDDIKEGCTILRRHAEALKVKFGSALASESLETEVVCIPGLRGRDAKEITLRNLASIIQARMEEIIEHVYYEIRNSGYEKKLIAGIVVTGGGAQLKHITQLFEFITGMTTRIGLPTEHLASTNTIDSIVSPMYSTGIGLVMKGFEGVETNRPVETTAGQVKTHSNKSRGSFFDTIITKSKNWFAEDDY